jgi:hypothetical protein
MDFELEGGIAIGLVSTPGVVAGVGFETHATGLENRLAEAGALLGHLLEEGLDEGARRRVVHLPTGGHHAAHAHVDKLSRQTGGKSPASRAYLAQLAAVEEDEVGNTLHLADLGGSEEQTVGEHHAAAMAAVGGPPPWMPWAEIISRR